MRRSASILIATSLLLATPRASSGYTPRPPPTPRSCRASCQGKGDLCLESCARLFAQKPWRERIALEEGRARPCLEKERRCKGRRCQSELRACLWAALDLEAAKMTRCWAAHRKASGRCQRHEGKGGWTCRNEADVQLHGCRKRALRRSLDDDSYRVRAAIEEDLGRELGTP